MSGHQKMYSIVQFSPRPDRFEFVNVGVLVFDNEKRRVHSNLTSNFSRVKRVFGESNPSFLKLALHDFAESVRREFKMQDFEISSAAFNSKRAGIFRLTPILPVSGAEVEQIAANLFYELVEIKPLRKRAERVSKSLTAAFKRAGVLPFLERRPESVRIEKWGVNIKADYGYQNGVYNLINAARFDEAERGIAEAGKRAIEARALAEMSEHRLIVVGEFGSQPDDYIDTIRNELSNAHAMLFTLDEVDDLAAVIRRTAH